MGRMSELSAQKEQIERLTGPLSMSEADLAALETRGRELVEAGKLVYQHMRHCDAYGSMDQLEACETLLKYIGIWDQVVPQPITQPKDY